MKKLIIIGVLSLAAIISGIALAQDPVTVDVRATWNPPTEGSPVVHYVLQLSVNEGPFETYATTEGTTLIVNVTMYDVYVARVAGVDALGRQGPWSLPSAPYTYDPGIPGAPGIPVIVVEE